MSRRTHTRAPNSGHLARPAARREQHERAAQAPDAERNPRRSRGVRGLTPRPTRGHLGVWSVPAAGAKTQATFGTAWTAALPSHSRGRSRTVVKSHTPAEAQASQMPQRMQSPQAVAACLRALHSSHARAVAPITPRAQSSAASVAVDSHRWVEPASSRRTRRWWRRAEASVCRTPCRPHARTQDEQRHIPRGRTVRMQLHLDRPAPRGLADRILTARTRSFRERLAQRRPALPSDQHLRPVDRRCLRETRRVRDSELQHRHP